MRKQLLGVFLPLLMVVLIAAAETQNTGTEATGHAALQKVNVVRGDHAISVEITARGPVNPKLETLASPARVVVNLPNTVMATGQNHIGVDDASIKGVRIGMDGQTPPTTRVVVDLAAACRSELTPVGDNKLVLKLTPTTVASVKPTVAAAPKAALVPVVAKQQVAIQPAVASAAPQVSHRTFAGSRLGPNR